MIRLRHVSRIYSTGEGEPVVALNDVSAEIQDQEFVSITGPSGCGKSTLMHILGGLDTPTSGEVFLGDLALHTAGEAALTDYRRHRLGIVFQFFNLLPAMNVIENVTLPLLLQGLAPEEAEPRGIELLELVGLGGKLRKFPNELSGGELQRTAIARALVHRPTLLLADEPTGNLDTANAKQVLDVLQKIASQAMTTLVVVTHSDPVAERTSRRIQMRDGRIV